MRRPYPDGRPPSIRDFMAFEGTWRRARGNRGLRGSRRSGTRFRSSTSPTPGRSTATATRSRGRPTPTLLDYELELACVIGDDGRPEGFTIMNDFSARDLQFEEMPVGLGPAKGKDFATALGPVLVVRRRAAGRPRHACDRARQRRGPDRLAHGRDVLVAGRQLLAAAARNTPGLVAGDVIGSGTVGARLRPRARRRALAGAGRRQVELEIEGIGVLRNRMIAGGRSA